MCEGTIPAACIRCEAGHPATSSRDGEPWGFHSRLSSRSDKWCRFAARRRSGMSVPAGNGGRPWILPRCRETTHRGWPSDDRELIPTANRAGRGIERVTSSRTFGRGRASDRPASAPPWLLSVISRTIPQTISSRDRPSPNSRDRPSPIEEGPAVPIRGTGRPPPPGRCSESNPDRIPSRCAGGAAATRGPG